MLLIFCYVYVHMSGYMAFIYCGRLIFSNQRTCLSNLPWRGMLSWCFIPCLECCLSSHSSKTQPSSGTELTSPLSGTLPWPAHPEMAFFSFLPSFSKYVLKVHSLTDQGDRDSWWSFDTSRTTHKISQPWDIHTETAIRQIYDTNKASAFCLMLDRICLVLSFKTAF